MSLNLAQVYLLMVIIVGSFLAGMMTMARGFVYAACVLVALSIMAGCSAPALFH